MTSNNSSLINIKNIIIRNKSNYGIKSIIKRVQSKNEIVSKNNSIQFKTNINKSRNLSVINKKITTNNTTKEEIKEFKIFFYRIFKFGNDSSTIKNILNLVKIDK